MKPKIRVVLTVVLLARSSARNTPASLGTDECRKTCQDLEVAARGRTRAWTRDRQLLQTTVLLADCAP